MLLKKVKGKTYYVTRSKVPGGYQTYYFSAEEASRARARAENLKNFKQVTVPKWWQRKRR